MNQEEALVHIKGIVTRSPELTECRYAETLKRHMRAVQILDKLIAQRTAKRLWREQDGPGTPDHAQTENHPIDIARFRK